MLEIKKLNAGYSKLQVLFDINLKVHKNRITTIIGPNGSGKSTLLKAIFGLVDIYSGKILLDGKDITRMKPHEKVKEGIVYIPQTENVFTNLTVKENLRIAGYTMNKLELKKKIDDILELFPVLKKYMEKKVMFLSGGERQMLAIAMGLIKEPKIIMLDEPTANLSPKVSKELFEKILELKNNKDVTILLVEQNVKKALEISDYSYVLVSGRKIFEGTSKDVLNNTNIGKIYLGVS